jgi:flagellar motor switch protein FliG
MAAGLETSPEVKIRVADMITSRLSSEDVQAAVANSGAADHRQEQLRKVAVLLRTLEKPVRETMLAAITSQDAESAKAVRKLMVIWEDLVLVADRTLQEVLRTIDTRKLALALVKADAATVKKVRSNISERAGAMVDEETSLLSSPKWADTLASRENILDTLRALNNKGELPFIHEEQS